MSYYYRFFGLAVACNEPIPGLSPIQSESFDLRVVLGSAPESLRGKQGFAKEPYFTSSMKAESGDPAFHIFRSLDDSVARIAYADGTEFWLDTEDSVIWARWPHSSTLADAASYLLGPVLGIYLMRKGTVCLHASAVIVEGQAVLFAGASGAGKSTSAAAMARRGHPLLADDIVATVKRGNEYLAVPAYPYISLWPGSPALVRGEESWPRISPDMPKIRMAPREFHAEAAPLGRIYILGERSENLGSPRIRKLPPQGKLMALVEHSYTTFVLDRVERAREFEFLGEIARAVEIQILETHSDPMRLDELCELIERPSHMG